MPNYIESLAKHLRSRRKKAGISQEELAKRTGISLTLIRDIERKEANPTLSNLGKIAEAFNISIAELLDFNDDLTNPESISENILAELKQLPAEKLQMILLLIRMATK